MKQNRFDMGRIDIAWCPGCGNFGILNALKTALSELEIDPGSLVMVSGIGQAAKIPHYLRANVFNGLHGRALPAATAIKASNPSLVVVAESGEGDMYGEGGNHFMHAVRRNPDIAHLVHNNMVYGLTKGQASPTSRMGFHTPIQVDGVILEPFNPVAVAVALDASFVARAYIKEFRQTVDLIKEAVTHRGYALVDILQPCVSFNKENTYGWFEEHTYRLVDDHSPEDRAGAFAAAVQEEKIPLGVIYRNPRRKVYGESISAYREKKDPLYMRRPEMGAIRRLMAAGC